MLGETGWHVCIKGTQDWDSHPHKQSRGSPLFNGVQKLLEGPEGCALTPDAQATHVDHVAGLRST